MIKSVIKCSKCESRFHYHNYTNKIPPLGLKVIGVNIGPIPSGEWLCGRCVFNSQKIIANKDSKKFVVGSFSPKTKQLDVYQFPGMWLRTKNVGDEQLSNLEEFGGTYHTHSNSRKRQGEIDFFRATHPCVLCGKVLKIKGSYSFLACPNCRLTLESLGTGKDPKSHHWFVYGPLPRLAKKDRNYLTNNSKQDGRKPSNTKSISSVEMYDDNDTWTEEDKKRIQEENGFSDEDMANGAWIDF